MGMFDYVTCHYKEMPKKYRGEKFQSKSMYRNLDHYIMEYDGYLSMYAPWSRDEIVPVHHIKEMRIYTSDKDTNEWIEYLAKFEDAKLIYIKQVGPPA